MSLTATLASTRLVIFITVIELLFHATNTRSHDNQIREIEKIADVVRIEADVFNPL
jgi:hypothetical protein